MGTPYFSQYLNMRRLNKRIQDSPNYMHGYSSLDILSDVALGELTMSPTSDCPTEGRYSVEADDRHRRSPDLKSRHVENSFITVTQTYSRTPLPAALGTLPPESSGMTVVRIENQPIEISAESPPMHRPSSYNKLSIVKGIRKPTKPSVWKNRNQPSRFCHICSRTSKKVGLIACRNNKTGACRKVVCEKCFAEYGWDWESATLPGADWVCTHCRLICPRRAQCAIYKRTNERRREQQQQHRAQMETIREMELARVRMRNQEITDTQDMNSEFCGIVRQTMENSQCISSSPSQAQIDTGQTDYFKISGRHNSFAFQQVNLSDHSAELK